MKFIAGGLYKQINNVYLYSNTDKVHFYGEYKDYLINENIKYLNIAVQNNNVFFIPCFIKEYKKLNKSDNLPITISHDQNKGSLSCSCKKLIDYFNIVDKKSIKKGQKFEGYNLNYVQVNIDKNRKGICFEIPKDIMGDNSEIFVSEPISDSSKESTDVEKIKIRLRAVTMLLNDILEKS